MTVTRILYIRVADIDMSHIRMQRECMTNDEAEDDDEIRTKQ